VATSLSAFAGYSLARFQFPGRGFSGVLIRVTQMLPGIAIITPLFASIPRELEEAAQIDGADLAGAFPRIVIPLSLPGLLATPRSPWLF
jgi:multiple sugar transport system permease protein